MSVRISELPDELKQIVQDALEQVRSVGDVVGDHAYTVLPGRAYVDGQLVIREGQRAMPEETITFDQLPEWAKRYTLEAWEAEGPFVGQREVGGNVLHMIHGTVSFNGERVV